MAQKQTISLQYRLAGLLARNSLQTIWEQLYLVSLRGLGYNNPIPHLNGENCFSREWLRRNGREQLVVFDVGANDGNFTANFKLHAPASSQYFLFEPNPKTLERLRRRFTGDPHVQVLQAGVGSAPGRLPLYDVKGAHGTEWASFHQEAITELVGKDCETTYAEITTVDAFCAAHNIRYIDFLKIDTEGFEREVLKGAAQLLESHRIHTIQLEWNDLNVFSGFTVYHLCKLLPGFRISRLLPAGSVPVIPEGGAYTTRFDIPRYCNLVCADPRFSRTD